MPSLKEIKTRIASVNSTRKITSAMKMVASSKLHHAQVMIENMLPYETMLEHILKTFLASEADASNVFTIPRPVKRVALVVFSSNSSLCGGFNTNVLKMMENVIAEYESIGKENVVIYPVGRKVAEKAAKLGLATAGNFVELADKPQVKPCIDIARELGSLYIKGEIDKVEIIYHHFKSAGSQILTRKTFLPIDVHSELQRDHERDLTSILASIRTTSMENTSLARPVTVTCCLPDMGRSVPEAQCWTRVYSAVSMAEGYVLPTMNSTPVSAFNASGMILAKA